VLPAVRSVTAVGGSKSSVPTDRGDMASSGSSCQETVSGCVSQSYWFFGWAGLIVIILVASVYMRLRQGKIERLAKVGGLTQWEFVKTNRPPRHPKRLARQLGLEAGGVAVGIALAVLWSDSQVIILGSAFYGAVLALLINQCWDDWWLIRYR